MPKELTRREAIEFLGILPKHFDNYFQSSEEIKGYKRGARWCFSKKELEKWKQIKKSRTVILTLKEYEKCFEFAIKMAYSTRASHGTGIRGVRSEMQMADDFILGILAEHGLKKFLRDKFSAKIKLDMEVHPDHITPQDILEVKKNGRWKKPRISVAVKSSKLKSCFNVIPPIEYENTDRKSDIYIFARVGLPSDHLFRILRSHSFFKKVKDELEADERFRKIEALKNIPIWICGYNKHRDFDRVRKIPGQEFDGYRYAKSVAKMKNSDKDWRKFVRAL